MIYKEKTCYIAGPMTGLPEFNYPSFHKAENFLKKIFKKVINPARNFKGDQTLDRPTYLREGIRQVTFEADCIVLLKGWKKSDGALLEVNIAEQLKLPVVKLKDIKKVVDIEKNSVSNK